MDLGHQEGEQRRRLQSTASVEFRSENKAMFPFRKRIGTLQKRVAFILARANASKLFAPEEAKVAIDAILADINNTAVEITASVAGRSHGPADNCRRALEVLQRRLKDLERQES